MDVLFYSRYYFIYATIRLRPHTPFNPYLSPMLMLSSFYKPGSILIKSSKIKLKDNTFLSSLTNYVCKLEAHASHL